jgi:hypothetical protein
VVSATSLTAVVPSGAASGKISVTTPGGTATSTQKFTVAASTARLAAEEEGQVEISLYPNPVLDKVTIDLKGISAIGAKTMLTDAVGKSVLVNAHKIVGESLLELDMSGLRSGLYIIQLRTEAASKVIKVIKY